MLLKKLTYIILLINFSGCSSLDNKTVKAGIAAFLTCSLVGAVTAPKTEKSEMHAGLYGGLCATGGMLLTETYFNSQNDKVKKSENEINELDIRNSIIKSKVFKSMDRKTKAKLMGEWDVFSKSEWFINGDKLTHENIEIKLN